MDTLAFGRQPLQIISFPIHDRRLFIERLHFLPKGRQLFFYVGFGRRQVVHLDRQIFHVRLSAR